MLTLDTDRIKLTRDLERRLQGMCEIKGACQIFTTPRRQMEVELYDGRKTVVSVKRVAYALSHPSDHVACTEEVQSICDNVGDPHTGNGACVNSEHLVKKSSRSSSCEVP